jgi:hypothetical protein
MLDPNSNPAAPKAIASTDENSQASRVQVCSSESARAAITPTNTPKATSTTTAAPTVMADDRCWFCSGMSTSAPNYARGC